MLQWRARCRKCGALNRNHNRTIRIDTCNKTDKNKWYSRQEYAQDASGWVRHNIQNNAKRSNTIIDEINTIDICNRNARKSYAK